MDKRYQIFISSTFTDLKEERKAIIEGLLNAKYIPAGMEMFAASNDEQFKYIKKIIDTCDYYVLIIGARYGSVNPSTGKSFTEQEYDYAIEKGIPVLAFLHDDPYNLPVEKREDDKRDLLDEFRNKVSTGRLCKMWHTPSELISSVIISLGEEVANNPQLGWTRGFSDSDESLCHLYDLRKRFDEREKEINNLKQQLKYCTEFLSNIANGKDKYIIEGTHSDWNKFRNFNRLDHFGEPRYYIEPAQREMTWDEIFSAVAPYLISPQNYSHFGGYLLKGINSSIGYDYFVSLNDDIVQTIKLWLLAHGLIDASPRESTDGGIIEFICLTEKGRNYLMQFEFRKN